MANDGFPERLLLAKPTALSAASFLTTQWLARGLVAVGVFNADQMQALLEWAAADAETIPGEVGMEAAAVIRSLLELPPINRL